MEGECLHQLVVYNWQASRLIKRSTNYQLLISNLLLMTKSDSEILVSSQCTEVLLKTLNDRFPSNILC